MPTYILIDLLVGIVIFGLLNLIFNNLSTKIYFFIIIFFPIVLFSILGTNGENILEFLIYIFKFFKNRKIYFYQKNGIMIEK